MYFPSHLEDFLYKINKNSEGIYKEPKKEILNSMKPTFDKVINNLALSKPILKKNSMLKNKKAFLNDIKSFFSEKIIKNPETQNLNLINEEYENIHILIDEEDYNEEYIKINKNKQSEIDNIINNLESQSKLLSIKNGNMFINLISNISEDSKKENKFNYLNSNSYIPLKMDNKLIGSDKELLLDSYLTCKEKEKYFDLIFEQYEIDKQKFNLVDKKILKSFKEESDLIDSYSTSTDNMCKVCNNADYEDQDLIIYCSECNLSVHQSCYGVFLPIGTEDWVCDVCQTFSSFEAETLECILCPVKGGAMKKCNLKISSNFYQNIMNIRKSSNNNNLHNSNNLNSNSTTPNDDSVNTVVEIQNLEYLSNICISEEEEVFNINSVSASNNKSVISEITSSTHLTSSTTNNNNNLSIKSFKYKFPNTQTFAWVHLSCALWNSEVDIGDFIKKDEIRYLENIDKSRFKELCNICNLNNNGPTLKCSENKCKIRFHVECARINKYCFELLNIKGTLNYNIYCHDHRQHKLLKQIEFRKMKICDDIIDYKTLLEKIFCNYEKEYDCSLINNQKNQIVVKNKTSLDKKKKIKIKINNSLTKAPKYKSIKNVKKNNSNNPLNSTNFNKFTLQERCSIVTQFKTLCKLISNPNVIVIKKIKLDNNLISNCSNNSQFFGPYSQYIFEFDQNTFKNKLKYTDVNNNLDFPWYMIKVSKYTTEQIKSFFKKLIPDEIVYNRKILKRKNKHKTVQEKVYLESDDQIIDINYIADPNNIETELNVDDKLYCYCKQKDEGQVMISNLLFV